MRPRQVQGALCVDGHAVVVIDALLSGSGHSGDDSKKVNPANSIVAIIGDIQVSIRIGGDATWVIEAGIGGGQ